MNYETASKLVHAAVDAANEQGLAGASVVVTDTAGNVVASARLDAGNFLSYRMAERKARTSAVMGAPTHAIAEMMKGDDLIFAAMSSDPAIVLLGGGFPVGGPDGVVGGIGVAGGHYSQDQAVAEAALASLG